MERLKLALGFIYSFAFIINLFFAMVLLGVPLYALRLKAGNLELGYLGGLGALTYTLSVPLSGWLSDRLSKRLLSFLGAMIFGLSVLFIPWVEKLNFLYPFVFGYSLGLALIWPAMESRLSLLVPGEKLSKIAGWYNLSWCLGFIFGPYLAGWLFERKLELVFWGAGLGGVLFSFLAIYPPAQRASQTIGYTEESGPVYFLYLSWLANIMTYFFQGILRNIFPKLGEGLGLSSSQLGILFLVMSLGQASFFVILNLSGRWHFKFLPLLLAQLGAFLGLMIIGFAGDLSGFIGGFFLVGSASGVTYFSSLYYAISLSQKRAGSRSGWHEFFIGAGALTGPVLGGIFAEFIGERSPYFIGAGMILGAILVELWYYNKSRA